MRTQAQKPKGARACRSKRRYRDAAQAREVMRRIQRRSTREQKPVRAYFCIHCRGYHLTSRPEP